jgi:hypothetical protein
MPFFSDTRPGGFQPKRGFRFLVSFSELGGTRYMVTDATKPTVAIKKTAHTILNHTFNFPGKVTWGSPSTINFIDAIDPNIGSKFYNALLNAGYVNPDSEAGLITGITKVQSASTLGEVKIQQLDGGGIILPAGVDPGELPGVIDDTMIVETWTLKNSWVTSVDWGKLNYGDDNLVKVAVKVEYDYATFERNNEVVKL